jgi:hypothetical protein
MVVEGYQTLEDKDNIDEVELDGPFPCRHKGAWLGFGCYLWDTRFEWAIEWGEFAYEKRGKDFIIGRILVDLTSDCFDLFGNVRHQFDFQEVIKVMLDSKKIKRQEEAIVANVIEFMKNQGIFNYKSIRAADMKNVKKYYFRVDRATGQPKEYMMINQRVQVCVIEKKGVLLRPFEVVYPDKYREQ